MKRNAFGQLIHSPHLRFAAEGAEGGSGKEFTPPATQEDLDKIINSAVGRTHKQYEDVQAKADKWDAHEKDQKPEPKPEAKAGDAPAGVSESDVDKRIADALAAKDKELAVERVGDALDKALEGRVYSAAKLLGVDREQFVKDGKHVDTEALEKWVKDNSHEGAAPSRRLRGQGERSSQTSGGSVQAGRDRFDNEKKPRKD